MKIFDHFDLIAPYYDRFIRPSDPQRIIELLGLSSDGYVLDAGGGTGRIAQHFPQFADRVIVADLSFAMLTQAQNKSGLEQVCSTTEMLPFESGFFQSISLVDALHHVHNQKKTCTELWRVLKPGGKLVIEEPDVDRFSIKILALAEKLLLMRSHFLSPAKIQACFQYSNASTRIEREGHIAWVIAEKLR